MLHTWILDSCSPSCGPSGLRPLGALSRLECLKESVKASLATLGHFAGYPGAEACPDDPFSAS